MGAAKGSSDRGAVSFVVDDAEVRKALNASKLGARPAMREAMIEAGSFLVREMRSRLEAHGKIDTGGTRDSIQAEITGRRGQIELHVGADEAHAIIAATLETGRRPGSKMPPKGVLLGWLQRHGLPPEAEYPVARKIARDGMRGQPFPFAQPTLDEGQEELMATFNSVLDAIGQAWSRA